jgi:spermidine/putrescine-binding protein
VDTIFLGVASAMDSQQFGSTQMDFIQPGIPSGFTRRSRRKFLQQAGQIALGLGLTQGLSSCGWRLGNVRSGPVKASTDELFLYTWAQYVDDDLLRDFQTKSGLKTIRELFDSNEKMIAALQAGKGDSFSLLPVSISFPNL